MPTPAARPKHRPRPCRRRGRRSRGRIGRRRGRGGGCVEPAALPCPVNDLNSQPSCSSVPSLLTLLGEELPAGGVLAQPPRQAEANANASKNSDRLIGIEDILVRGGWVHPMHRFVLRRIVYVSGRVRVFGDPCHTPRSLLSFPTFANTRAVSVCGRANGRSSDSAKLASRPGASRLISTRRQASPSGSAKRAIARSTPALTCTTCFLPALHFGHSTPPSSSPKATRPAGVTATPHSTQTSNEGTWPRSRKRPTQNARAIWRPVPRRPKPRESDRPSRTNPDEDRRHRSFRPATRRRSRPHTIPPDLGRPAGTPQELRLGQQVEGFGRFVEEDYSTEGQ